MTLENGGAATGRAPSGVRYVAGSRLLIGESYREVGESVPEAAGWPDRQVRALVGIKRLIVVEEPAPPARRRK